MSRPAVLFLSMLFVCLPGSSQSFIGNVKLGSVQLPCAVGCGGSRGVVNFGFAGDAVNSFISGPSIDAFREAANQAADRATKSLDTILTQQKADFFQSLAKFTEAQRTALITDLNTATQSALGDLDIVLQRQLREADQLLETRLGTLDVVLNQNTLALSSALKRVLVFALVLGTLAYATWVFYQSWFVQKRPLRAYLPKLMVVGVLFIGLAGLVYVVNAINDSWARRELVAQFDDFYGKALEQQKFFYAVYYATQLQYIDRFDVRYTARAEKAQLLRDVFSRPALYKSQNGARELLARIGSAQKAFYRSTKQLDTDLNILLGFATWQRGDDRFSEYVAACILADQIAHAKSSTQVEKPTLLPLAYYYLTAYLSNPLPDSVIAKLYQDNEQIAADQVFVALNSTPDSAALSPLRRRYKVTELQSVVTGAKIDIEELARSNSLYAYVRVSLETVKTYRAVVSQYSELLRLQGQLSLTPEGPSKNALRASIRAAGKTIVEEWNAYETFLNKADYADQTAKLNNFRGLWPIYTRGLGAMQIKDNTDNLITPATEDRGIHRKWLFNVVQASVRETTYQLVRTTTQSDYTNIDGRLGGLEKAVRDYFDALNKGKQLIGQAGAAAEAATAAIINSGGVVATESSALGIFGCRSSTNAKFACDFQGSLPEPFGTLLFRETSGLDEKVVNVGPVVSRLVSTRTIPAF
ncbi:hypothetical protein I6F36_22975 [Bradyrhizobium sp. BRP19]|nr:hypothetical protein [Bradyrhizobium sp. BRP19]